MLRDASSGRASSRTYDGGGSFTRRPRSRARSLWRSAPGCRAMTSRFSSSLRARAALLLPRHALAWRSRAHRRWTMKMPRFVQGDQFWEIEREGTNLVITSGTVGTAGKEQIRRYKTAGHAEIQYDVMIRDKVAAGFEATTARPAPVAHEADATRNAELDEAIAADPYDTSAYAVYADWLQARGDPRGELIALQLAEDAKPGDSKLVASIGRQLEKHAAVYLGPLA